MTVTKCSTSASAVTVWSPVVLTVVRIAGSQFVTLPATSVTWSATSELSDWFTLVDLTTTADVVPTEKAGTTVVAFVDFVTTIDFRPLELSDVVTWICVGGPTMVAVSAHAGGVLSRTIEFPTVNVNGPVVAPIPTDAGEYVGAAHAYPAMGARAASDTVQVLPVGIPVTV